MTTKLDEQVSGAERYSAKVKRGAIAIVDSRGLTVTVVARELGVSPESLRNWYRQAKVDRGDGRSGKVSSAECEELKRLRKQNAEQAKTIEALRKAALFVAKESDR